MKRVKIVIAALLIVYLIVLVILNRDGVPMHLLFGTLTMSKSLLLLVTFLVGLLCGVLLGSNMARGKSRRG